MALSIDELKAALLALDAETRSRLMDEVDREARLSRRHELARAALDECGGERLDAGSLAAEVADRRGGVTWDD